MERELIIFTVVWLCLGAGISVALWSRDDLLDYLDPVSLAIEAALWPFVLIALIARRIKQRSGKS